MDPTMDDFRFESRNIRLSTLLITVVSNSDLGMILLKQLSTSRKGLLKPSKSVGGGMKSSRLPHALEDASLLVQLSKLSRGFLNLGGRPRFDHRAALFRCRSSFFCWNVFAVLRTAPVVGMLNTFLLLILLKLFWEVSWLPEPDILDDDDVSRDASDVGRGGAIVLRPQKVERLNSDPDLNLDLFEDKML